VLKEERRLRVFENTVLKKTFETNRRRLNNEELKDLHFPTNISRMIKFRKMRWVVYVTHGGRVAYTFLVGKPEGSRAFRRTRRR
jgi:hypothetical protein